MKKQENKLDKNNHKKNKSNMIAKKYYSGFSDAHETYNAISAASDGKIYYVLCSAKHDIGAQMYVYDPSIDNTEHIADLSEVLGEKSQKYISQGKSHTEFYEDNDKLYFATHVGYYEMIDGAQQLPVNAPEGFKLYPGGHFLYYDMVSKEIKSLAVVPEGEGVLTMAMDKKRQHLYGITWPTGYFIDYDIKKNKMKNLGPISGGGEKGKRGEDYRVLCRSLLVNPEDGSVYYSTSEGDIYSYNPLDSKTLQKLHDVNLRLDYFGKYDPKEAGSMGYNWRKIHWYEPEGKAYGVHGNSGYLFTFDPKNKKIEIVDRITSEPSKKSGMFDMFSYGYLGFEIKDGVIYYLTGAPIYEDGKRIAGLDKISMGAPKGIEHLHLITYDINRNEYNDLGPIFYEEDGFPTYVNSIAVGNNKDIYTIARFKHNGKSIDDLIKIITS